MVKDEEFLLEDGQCMTYKEAENCITFLEIKLLAYDNYSSITDFLKIIREIDSNKISYFIQINDNFVYSLDVLASLYDIEVWDDLVVFSVKTVKKNKI